MILGSDSEKEVTRELVRSRDDIFIYYMGKEKIEIRSNSIVMGFYSRHWRFSLGETPVSLTI
ncbi:hypothetical protein PbDSM24746_59930 [Paenibacillus macerans]|uniref:Uncharacterized protein n=1 Tax=Paenibacillus macerans TaxID=44252 RepID=A0A090ZVY5_PAEMA|nr:hypothetical protein DJ90_1583 [Paenibacillus macerans]GBK65989.1 hypothetical protein PbDSM24746_59930 [Paenibacillus macerans]GBK72318.1 hypothetical protein PbJCM17693_60260 [Paenibacillus macerans]GIP12455.1 hypothetical protein J1TS5_46250 [Paenibacillus macerans]